jgi:hypothetical protein
VAFPEETAEDGNANRDWTARYALQGIRTLGTPAPSADLIPSTVSYAGTGHYRVRVDGSDSEYAGDFDWQDNSSAPNGDADDTGDVKNPVGYVHGSRPAPEVEFRWATRNHPTGTVLVKGVGPDGIEFAETSATVYSDHIAATLSDDSPASPLTSSAKYYPNFAITWYAKVGNGSYQYVGTTRNELFVTYSDDTPPDDSRFRTVLHLATQNGGSTSSGCLSNTWASFTGLNVCKWKPATTGTNGAYTDPLQYYGNGGTGNITTKDLLAYNDGQCGAHACLLHDSWLANGITSSKTTVGPCAGYNGFAVKNVGFSGSPPYPYSSINTGVSGTPGQNTPTPGAKLFQWHFMVHPGYFASYYDPSYGATYYDEEAFTSAAVAAWWAGPSPWLAYYTPPGAQECVTFTDGSF